MEEAVEKYLVGTELGRLTVARIQRLILTQPPGTEK